jgi:hypothetical protein
MISVTISAYKRCLVRLCLQLFVRRAHVLLTMLSSSLPSVVCRRVHVLFTLFLFVYV